MKDKIKIKIKIIDLLLRFIDCGGFVALTMRHPLSAKVGTNFVDKLWSLSRYSLRLRTQAMEFVLFVCFCCGLYLSCGGTLLLLLIVCVCFLLMFAGGWVPAWWYLLLLFLS
jgi:hypothetical protein